MEIHARLPDAGNRHCRLRAAILRRKHGYLPDVAMDGPVPWMESDLLRAAQLLSASGLRSRIYRFTHHVIFHSTRAVKYTTCRTHLSRKRKCTARVARGHDDR